MNTQGVIKKLERIRGLQALLDEYEDLGLLKENHSYLKNLRLRIQKAKVELRAMTGDEIAY